MQRKLDVYLHENLAGHLIQDSNGQMLFEYAESWLENPATIPLSHSLPLAQKKFNRNACRGFFAGILPEENKRKIIAGNLGISAKNDFAMLELIGGECAGAVTFVNSGQQLPTHNASYKAIIAEGLAEILQQLPSRPLMAGEDGMRLSLAGAQDKIAVHIANNVISLPLAGTPSTHIIKPAIAHFTGLVFNEYLCMQLAKKIGINTANVEIGNVCGIDYLQVERYDRKILNKSDELMRIHQEDFCQALGIIPENKYQNEGGPSLKQCFALLRSVSSVPVRDLQALLDAVIFNVLIGNNDAHGKNFSLLYNGETRLAPLYDLVCTRYYHELSAKLAMKIDREYLPDKLTAKHFELLAGDIGFAKQMLKRRTTELTEITLNKLTEIAIEHEVMNEISAFIKHNCEQMLIKLSK
ncbi:MAG: type II toxin-antitoxin system HipA family toxin [Pseudomonadota bacterium]